jgi:hypothetical protein
VFIFGRRREALDEAVKLIGANVIAIQADASKLKDLDRVAEIVRSAKGKVDVIGTDPESTSTSRRAPSPTGHRPDRRGRRALAHRRCQAAGWWPRPSTRYGRASARPARQFELPAIGLAA